MFGLGFTEILLIIVVAIVFLGPDKLPSFLVDVAKFFKGVKKAIDDAKNSLDEEVRISELREEALKYKQKLQEAQDNLKSFETNIQSEILEDKANLVDLREINNKKINQNQNIKKTEDKDV